MRRLASLILAVLVIACGGGKSSGVARTTIPPRATLRVAAESLSRAGLIGSGAHGYDPRDPLMEALFIAHGPDIRPGRLGDFDNVEVYGLLMALLGLPPEPGAAPAPIAAGATRDR